MIDGLNAKGCCNVGFACSRSADMKLSGTSSTKSHDALLTPFMRAERHPDGLHQSQADLSLRNELQILSLDVPDTMEP